MAMSFLLRSSYVSLRVQVPTCNDRMPPKDVLFPVFGTEYHHIWALGPSGIRDTHLHLQSTEDYGASTLYFGYIYIYMYIYVDREREREYLFLVDSFGNIETIIVSTLEVQVRMVPPNGARSF